MMQIGSAIANGLTIAMALFLTAAGLTLLFGILRILNFAQGTFIVIGAYIASMIIGKHAVGPAAFVGIAAITGCCMLLFGAVIDRLVFRRLRHVDESSALIATFALMMVAHGLTKLLWGSDFVSVNPPAGLEGAVFAGKIIIPQYSIFLWLVGLITFAGLEWAFGKLWFGKVVSCAAGDGTMMSLLGYDVSRLVFVAVLISFFLAGFAGGILVPNQTLQPSLSDTFIIQAFAVVIIGGLGSIRGAFIASLLLGIAESLGATVMPSLALYLGMIVILLVRPQGLVATGPAPAPRGTGGFLMFLRPSKGQKPQPRKLRPETADHESRTGRPAGNLDAGHTGQRLIFGFGMFALAVLATAPIWGGGGIMYVAGFILIDAVFAMSWNLLFGYAGMAVFGHAAFFAAGAYLVGFFLKTGADIPFLVLIPCAVGVGMMLAAPLGAISLRRSGGLQLAILTLAFSEVFRILVSYSARLGRDEGLTAIPRPSINLGFGSIPLASELAYFLFLCVACTIAISLMWWITHSGFGRALRCIKEDPERARFIGINVDRYRLAGFIIASGFASLAGALAVPLTQIVTPESANVAKSTAPMLSSLLGGAGTFWGPLVGTATFAAIQYGTRTLAGLSELVMGATLLVVVLAAPAGLVGFSIAALKKWKPSVSQSSTKQRHPGDAAS